MAGFFEDDLIEEIRSRADIVEVVSDYVRLQRTGKNFKGLCPFHSEKTPSFSVNPEKQFYYCFGCGAGGSVFNFIMKIENVEFPQAVRLLAERTGVSLPEEISGQRSRQAELRSLIYRVNEAAAEFFIKEFFSERGKEAREYLKNRGIDRKTAEAFRLGYAPQSWDALQKHLVKLGFPINACLQAGLILENQKRKSTYDRFRGRLMFPILDPAGRTVAFGGRILGEGEPKYLNSPETPVFAKGRNLYGFNMAREQIRAEGTAIIVEGYMDVIGLHQAGIKNSVASLGTALTQEQAGLIARNAGSVVIAYDADAAGQAATLRGLDLLRAQGLPVSVVTLPKGEDPDSYVRKEGAKAFKKLVSGSEGLVEYKLRIIGDSFDLTDPQGKGRAAHKVAEILASVDSPVECEAYIGRAAAMLGVSPGAIQAEIVRYKEKAGKQRRYRHTERKNSYTNEDQRRNLEFGPGRLDQANSCETAEKDLVAMLINDGSILAELRDSLDPEDFTNESLRNIVAWLVSDERRSEPDEAVSAAIARLQAVAKPPLTDPEIVRACMGKIKESRFRRDMAVLEAELDRAVHEGETGHLVEMLYKFREMIDGVSQCM